MRAVYLLLIGDPIYAHWAVNLAASVKFYSPDMRIVLLHEPGMKQHVHQSEQFIFDEYIEIDRSVCYDGEKLTPGIAKLNMYKYFHHEENLYIDVDSLMLKDINGLFDQNKDKIIGCDVVSKHNEKSESWPCIWASLPDVRSYYKLPETYNLFEINSSYIYTKKCDEAERFWNQAKDNIIKDYEGRWGKSFPDELAFDVAFAQTGINPETKTSISCDSKLSNIGRGVDMLKDHYSILTYWGGKNNNHITHYKNYDMLAGVIHRRIFGKHNPYKYSTLMRNKYVQTQRSRLTNRQNVTLPPVIKHEQINGVKKVTIVGRDNGVGLSKDKRILTDVLSAYDVDFRSIDHFKPLQPGNDVCIFTEIVNPRYYGRYNILIPNQEWFFTDWIKELKNFQAIWVKTKLAYQIYSSMHPNVKYIGFTSVDMYKEGPKVKEFFHTKGKSMEKGTEHLQYWASDLPKLNLITQDKFSNKPNVNHIKNRLGDAQFIELANKCLIHLCPSTQEGFGHYINEAKSMGNVVITTDAAPMNELITDKRFLLKVTQAYHKEGTLGTFTKTTYEEIDRVVRSIIDLDLIEIGRQNREEFLKQDLEFKQTIQYEFSKI